MTASEYLQRAALCERRAQVAGSIENRDWLLDAAKSWRLLAREAARAEPTDVADPPIACPKGQSFDA